MTGVRRDRAPAPPPLPPWWERHPKVFVSEMARIEALNREQQAGLRPRWGVWDPTAPESPTNPRCLIVRGSVREKAPAGEGGFTWRRLVVDICYPPGFPFDPPDVRPVNPALGRRRHQVGLSGDICYLQEEMQPWRLQDGIERALAGARAFWRSELTGVWPREVPASELLSYLDTRTAAVGAVLIPPHAGAPPSSDAPWGTFDLEVTPEARAPAVLGTFRRRHHRQDVTAAAAIREVNDRLWVALRRQRRLDPVVGLWFALEREPEPFHTVDGLERVLADVGGQPRGRLPELFQRHLTPDVMNRGWMPIALYYPPRPRAGGAGEPSADPQAANGEWLFLTLEWGKLPGGRAANRRPDRLLWTRIGVAGVPSYVTSSAALRKRVGAVYPEKPLQDAHVMVVGVGALGSTVARSLAAAGVCRFTLVDHDVMKPGNIVRHELRLPDVGRQKVAAMRQAILETNPYAEVTIISDGTRGTDRSFDRAILDRTSRPSLVIVTTAVRAVDGQVDALARLVDPPIPVLHAWVYAQAQVLRAFLYRPGRTACTWCTELHREDEHLGRGDGRYLRGPTPVPEAKADPFFETSCASPAHPGAGNANALAAGLIVEMALDALEGDAGIPDDATHWVWAGHRIRRVDPTYPLAPASRRVVGLPPHPQCPVCADDVLSDGTTPEEQSVFVAALTRVGGGAAVTPRPPASQHDGHTSLTDAA